MGTYIAVGLLAALFFFIGIPLLRAAKNSSLAPDKLPTLIQPLPVASVSEETEFDDTTEGLLPLKEVRINRPPQGTMRRVKHFRGHLVGYKFVPYGAARS